MRGRPNKKRGIVIREDEEEEIEIILFNDIYIDKEGNVYNKSGEKIKKSIVEETMARK